MNVLKTFTHNGGVWTRPDIPSSVDQTWKCHVCQKDVGSETEEYAPGKLRYIPDSRYWHGTLPGVQYCSPECSIIHHTELNAKP